MAFFVLATGLLAGTAIAMAQSDHYCQHHPYDCDCCEEDAAYYCYGKLQVEVLEARNVLQKGQGHSKHKYFVEVLKSKDGRYYTSYDRTSTVKGINDVSFVHGECKHAIHHHLGYFLLLKRTISAKSGPPTVILLLKKKGYWGDKVVGGAVIELQQSSQPTSTPMMPPPPASSTQKTDFQAVQTTPGSQEMPGFGFDLTRDFDRRITIPLHAVRHGQLKDPIPANLDVVLHYRPINVQPPIQAQVPVYIPQTVVV
jgi:hypothetical protein